MRDVSLKQLRVVAAIAKTGKVSSAADLIGVTAPAVTLQLKQLEDSLGVILFERSREGMKPTAAGQHLVRTAGRIEAELSACADSLGALRGLTGGTVSIGVVSTAKYFAPAALGAFKRLHPALDLKLFVGNREDTIKGLAALEFDLVIMGRPPENMPLKSAILGDHPHVIVARPDHPLAGARGLSLVDLGDEVFLLREQGSGTRMLMERLFDEAGVAPRVGMEMSSNETIKQAVMAGLGIAFISGHTTAAEVEMRRLIVLDVLGLPALRHWQLVRHAEKRLMPAPGALWDFLHREARHFLPPPHLAHAQ
jgi:LysR family transcriptional regulator for metE and metH